ncbi:MAG: porin family protein [Myxococcota bacterium]|nr:porin family protein [Myxococcota bacterium]
MRIAAISAVAVYAIVLAALPARATANTPVTAGVSAGVHHDEVDADGEGNRTLGLFGRVGFAKRLSGQLEVMKIDTDDATYTATNIRTATVSLRLDLIDPARSRFVPTISFGAGIDRASTDYDTTEGHHFEGGFGLEYRAEGGFTIGVDLRFGGRSIEDEDVAVPAVEGDVARPLIYDGGGLREGEYRALRATAGIAF